MSEKELGQTAYEAWAKHIGLWSGWDRRISVDKAQWAAVERAVLEKAARIAEPKRQRPCDCDRCYCGNPGDAQAVAAWDADSAIAAAIRAAGGQNEG